MEITIRVVLDMSPRFAELLGRLVGGVAVQSTAGAPNAAAPDPGSDPAPIRLRSGSGAAPIAAGPAPADDPVVDLGDMVPAAAPGPEPAAETGAVAEPVGPGERRPRDNWRTPERRAVLERMYPAGDDIDLIRAALAALDGPPLPEPRYAVGHWAKYLKLSRPSDGVEPWRTPARQAVLKETWGQGVDVDLIVARMAALPGGPVLAARVSVWASSLGLSRPEWHAAKLARERTARLRETRWVPQEPVAAAVVVEPEPDPPAPPEPSSAAPLAQPRGAVWPLPRPSDDGVIRASFREIQAWAAHFGIHYDGANVAQVNRRRAGMGLAPVAQCEARTLAERQAA